MPSLHTLSLSAFAARRLPDEDAFDRALRGDPVAFAEVYRRYQKRVYGFALARSLDPHAAADVTQEVFVRLLHAPPGSIANPRAWLFSVARNVCVDVIRKHSRVDPVDSMSEETAALGSASALDPADVVLSKSEGRDVFLALQRLNPRYRTALILRELHGQSSKDIGEALDATVGAVDTLVCRARDAFGVAYANVLDLSPACRATVELIYRRLGSGISDSEAQALAAHCSQCESCRREAKKAARPGRLAALIPMLLPVDSLGNVFARAAQIGQYLPEAALQQAVSAAAQPPAMNAVQKVAAGLIAATLVTVPVVGAVSRPVQPTASRAVIASAVRPDKESRQSDGQGSPRAAVVEVTKRGEVMQRRGGPARTPDMKTVEEPAREAGPPAARTAPRRESAPEPEVTERRAGQGRPRASTGSAKDRCPGPSTTASGTASESSTERSVTLKPFISKRKASARKV